MITRRRKGFTLIELLVVIAIIAILAAMLFPVFARARESARKIQCLSNVKNIATAVQMYLTDYDRFPPGQHDPGFIAFLDPHPGGGASGYTCSPRDYYGDPYLRWPVILDEYVKNRDVWRCPSASKQAGASWIVPNYGNGPWYTYLTQTVGHWGSADSDCGGGPCCGAWPSGWGGEVTDSIAQHRRASPEAGGFELTVGTTASMMADVKTSQINDPTYVVVAGDLSNPGQGDMQTIVGILFPFCGLSSDGSYTGCGDLTDVESDTDRWNGDVGYRNKYCRHLGGVNLGFADGHATWWTQQAAMTAAPICGRPLTPEQTLRGLCPLGIAEAMPSWAQ